MKPAVVVDVGNSRIKWGRCGDDRIFEVAALPPEDEVAWAKQSASWKLDAGSRWILSGVQPAHRDRLRSWLLGRGHQVFDLTSFRQIPIEALVDHPERVGIDRLLNAVAANTKRPSGRHSLVIDAGSAVTVDLVDEHGRFRGGAIMPGLRLMADALHRKTAALPIVSVEQRFDPPGLCTVPAMQAGVFHAVLGGIESLIRYYRERFGEEGVVLFGGGDAAILAPHLSFPAVVWPEMTLEGIRLTALSLEAPAT